MDGNTHGDRSMRDPKELIEYWTHPMWSSDSDFSVDDYFDGTNDEFVARYKEQIEKGVKPIGPARAWAEKWKSERLDRTYHAFNWYLSGFEPEDALWWRYDSPYRSNLSPLAAQRLVGGRDHEGVSRIDATGPDQGPSTSILPTSLHDCAARSDEEGEGHPSACRPDLRHQLRHTVRCDHRECQIVGDSEPSHREDGSPTG